MNANVIFIFLVDKTEKDELHMVLKAKRFWESRMRSTVDQSSVSVLQ